MNHPSESHAMITSDDVFVPTRDGGQQVPLLKRGGGVAEGGETTHSDGTRC